MATNPDEAATETLKYQTWTLKVPIHCGGCTRKVKRVLQTIDGVFTTSIDSRLHKVVVIGDVDSETLIRKLVKSGKQAELWSEKKQGKKKDGESNRDYKDNGESDKPVENDSKDSDDEGENSSSETDQKAGEAKPAGSTGGGGGGGAGGSGGGGGNKKKKKKKKKKGQNANTEGSKDAPPGSQPHIAGPDPVLFPPAPSNTCRPNQNIDAHPPPLPHYAPVMSYSSAYPSRGTSYYYASPMNYSPFHHIGPYQSQDPMNTYRGGHDDPCYYNDEDVGGCSIV